MARTIDQAYGKIVIPVTRAMFHTVQLSSSSEGDARWASHSREETVPSTLSSGLMGRLVLPRARCTLGLRVSLPSAVNVLFLTLCTAHRLPPSNHPSTVAFPELTGCPAPGCPLCPPHSISPSPTLLSPWPWAPHSVLHSFVSLLMVHLPPTTRAEALPVSSAAGPPARGAGIDIQSGWVNQQASPCLVGRGRLSTSTVRFQSLPAQTIPLFHSQEGQESDLRFSSQTRQVGMMSSILQMRTMGLLGNTLKAVWRRAGIRLHGWFHWSQHLRLNDLSPEVPNMFTWLCHFQVESLMSIFKILQSY